MNDEENVFIKERKTFANPMNLDGFKFENEVPVQATIHTLV